MRAAILRRRRWWLAAGVLGGFAAFLAATGVASAHQGIPPGQTPLTAWGIATNPIPSLFLLGALYLYINGLSNWPKPQSPHQRVAESQLRRRDLRAVCGVAVAY